MYTTLSELQEHSRWLSRYAHNVTSQQGEDGIVEKALSVLPDRDRWCVEFGAWDGKVDSNTYALVNSHGYRGVFIEPDPVRFRGLQQTHGGSGRHILLNAAVGFQKSDNLDALLSKSDIPKDFDLLSIDIDGNDYHVWDEVKDYRPKLVLIEYNWTSHNSVLFVQEKSAQVSRGSSPASLVELARTKGYELIAVTAPNLLFVASEYYKAYDIPDNSLAVMRDESLVPKIFVGYDGHIFLVQGSAFGSIQVPWHGLSLTESKVQVLPGWLQKNAGRYSLVNKVVFGVLHPQRALRRFKMFVQRHQSPAPSQ